MIQSRCGILCNECRFTECKGCVNIDNPFWGNCPVKSCCEQKKHSHCGECAEFPCDLLNSFAYDEKEGDEGKRIEQCKKWKANIKFQVPLLAVHDVEISKQFYKDIFGQDVVLDLGTNVTFNGGFAIQQNFANLTTVSSDSVVVKSNNMELYFEVEDFDMFLSHLEQYPHIEFVHPPKKYAWQQRVVRIYDPDWHMIEIGESMESIAKRYLAKGLSVEKVAEIIQHPIGFVEKCNSEK